MSINYWKVSIFKEKVGGYVVYKSNLRSYEAKELVHDLMKQGVIARASAHKNHLKTYYYAK